MERTESLRRIAFLGDYLPRKCGIATFTHDLRKAITEAYPEAECRVFAVNDRPEGYEDYPEEVCFEIPEQELDAYERAADFLNFNNADVLSVQHEFGIYGGEAGEHLLELLRRVQMPVVTTLHTILEKPSPAQRRVMDELIARSTRLVTMSERGRTFLQHIYQAPPEKIDLIPHGIPDMPFIDPNFYKDQYDASGKFILLTFGLLSANKGIENVIRALPRVVAEYPDLLYIVLGATHPNVLRSEGEAYRDSLKAMVAELGLENHVVFDERFVELEELKQYIIAADIYITPYVNRAQITSGTLAYSFGCGKAVISTPYWHAEELLADDRGVLVPFSDDQAMATAITGLLGDKARRHAMRKRAYLYGREMVWSEVARRYEESFEKARAAGKGRLADSKNFGKSAKELPAIRLHHLNYMTDSTGIFQHARFSIPRFESGYCIDDNARALLLTLGLESLGFTSENVRGLGKTYAAFLDHAYNAEQKRFRNFMGFERDWLEEFGSADSNGRALWALGACVGRSESRSLQMWAAQRMAQAMPLLADLDAPRAWAFGLLGIYDYLQRFEGDRQATHLREVLTARLINLYKNTACPDWHWFEDTLTYDNARLSQAMLLSPHDEAIAIGLRSLRWLMQQQTAENGHFRPIGCESWYPRTGIRAQFDQQPLEACATVSACLAAFQVTEDYSWLNAARSVFDWFLGYNDLGQALFDPVTGGCCDGLQIDRVNQNQGAESTLSFLLALVDMHSVEKSFHTSYRQPAKYENPK